jgi:putative transposase
MSFVDAYDFPVDLVLRVLSIPVSTYYDWRARQAAPSRRQLEDAELLEMIVKIRTSHEFAATYGSPRVQGDCVVEEQVPELEIRGCSGHCGGWENG